MVGVGASAGGLDALTQMFSAMPDGLGLAFVVVQHLSPDHPSMMPELLARQTELRTQHILDGEEPKPNTIHILPPKHLVELEQGKLHLVPQSSKPGPSYAVDHLFRSLARERGPQAVGVVLSGSGSDGTQGVRAINEGGGLVIVQTPESADFDGMPRSARTTGLADFVVEPDEIPDTLTSIVNHVFDQTHDTQLGSSLNKSRILSDIFASLQKRCGIDFGTYKPGTTMRRIERRMVAVGARTLDEYLQILETSGGELDYLQRDLLIGVTKFFRDPRFFRVLESEIVPQIFERQGFDGIVRVWCAGCSTGEEAYSLAILLREYCQGHNIEADIKVFATDVDKNALEIASNGLYPEGIAADVSAERLKSYFVSEEGGFRVVSSLRNMLVFAPQNLLTDPPFTRIDLVSCRNVLIYLEPTTQRRLLSLFHFALKPGGVLFLGGSETVNEHVSGFLPIDIRTKLYRRTEGRPNVSENDWRGARRIGPADLHTPFGVDRDRAVLQARFHSELVERYAPTSILVDRLGTVLQTSGTPYRFLRITTGAATLDVGKIARPGLAPMLTTALQRVLRENNEVCLAGVNMETEDERRIAVNLRVTPMRMKGETVVEHVLIAFEVAKSGSVATTDENVEVITRDDYVRALENELRHNKDNLSATIEELETSNEELQATNEELLAANEELQSTNEELQATNEELHTVNSEYQRKIRELEELNADIDNFFRTANVGTLFLSRKLEIRRFTPAAARVVNVLHQDIGRPLSHLSDRIGGGSLLSAAQRVLDDGEGRDLEVQVDERDMMIQLRPYLGSEGGEAGVVVTFVDVTELMDARRYLQDVLDSMPQLICVVDAEGVIVLVNASWREQFNRGTIDLGTNYVDVVAKSAASGDESAQATLEGLRGLLSPERKSFTLDYPCHDEENQRWFLLHAVPLTNQEGAVIAHVAVTSRMRELGHDVGPSRDPTLEAKLGLSSERAPPVG